MMKEREGIVKTSHSLVRIKYNSIQYKKSEFKEFQGMVKHCDIEQNIKEKPLGLKCLSIRKPLKSLNVTQTQLI